MGLGGLLKGLMLLMISFVGELKRFDRALPNFFSAYSEILILPLPSVFALNIALSAPLNLRSSGSIR